jgi:hypothetical protein
MAGIGGTQGKISLQSMVYDLRARDLDVALRIIA